MGTRHEIRSTGALYSNVNSTTIEEIDSVSDFPAAVAGVIGLRADTTYIIRGLVDIGTDRLNVQAAGISIKGHDRNKDILYYDGVNTMITIGDPTLATYNEFNFTLDGLGLQAPNGRILEAENIDSTVEVGSVFGRTKVLQISNCEIKDTLKVWTIVGFELVDLLNNLIWFVDGLTSDSGCQFKSVRHLEINSCEVFNWTAVVTNAPRMIEIMPDNISTAGGLVSQFNAVVNIAGCIIHPINDQIGLYIDSASETKFGTVASNTFIDVSLNTPTGKLFDPLPSGGGYSLPSTLTYDIGLNQGIPNSVSYIFVTMTGVGVAQDVNPILDIDFDGNCTATNSQRFTTETFVDGGITGQTVTYIGTKDIYVTIYCTMQMTRSGGGTDAYTYSLWQDPATGTFAQLPAGEYQTGGVHSGEVSITMVYATTILTGYKFKIKAESSSNDTIQSTQMQWVVKE